MMTEDKAETELYGRWLRFLFDRPDKPNQNEWYWELGLKDFSASDEQKVFLIGKTFENSGTDLLKYSDLQVNNGLNYILNNIISDTVFLLTKKALQRI